MILLKSIISVPTVMSPFRSETIICFVAYNTRAARDKHS